MIELEERLSSAQAVAEDMRRWPSALEVFIAIMEGKPDPMTQLGSLPAPPEFAEPIRDAEVARMARLLLATNSQQVSQLAYRPRPRRGRK